MIALPPAALGENREASFSVSFASTDETASPKASRAWVGEKRRIIGEVSTSVSTKTFSRLRQNLCEMRPGPNQPIADGWVAR